MSDFDIKITGMSGALYNLKKLEKTAWSKAAGKSLRAAALVLRTGIKKNADLTDHTLKDLEGLDHPYARRHGSINVHSDKPYQIHRQTGAMRSKANMRKMGRGKSLRYRIGFDYAAVPYARYVVQGTRVLLPRDIVFKTSQQPEIRKQMMKAVATTLGKELRTGAGIRFY